MKKNRMTLRIKKIDREMRIQFTGDYNTDRIKFMELFEYLRGGKGRTVYTNMPYFDHMTEIITSYAKAALLSRGYCLKS